MTDEQIAEESFHSLKRDILILTAFAAPLATATLEFPFPQAGHFDSYYVITVPPNGQILFPFPQAGHFDSYTLPDTDPTAVEYRFHSLKRDILILTVGLS